MGKPGQAKAKVSGMEGVVEMLRVMDTGSREKLLLLIEKENRTLACNLRSQVFVFSDLQYLSPKEIQLLLRHIVMDTLALALKNAGAPLKKFFYENLSSRVAQDLKNTVDTMPPKRLSDVEDCQNQILELAKKLESEGKIILKKSEDTLV